MSEKRLIELETKFSFQEDEIKELGAMVYDQQKQIEQLQRYCESLKVSLKALTEPQNMDQLSDDKPPHY